MHAAAQGEHVVIDESLPTLVDHPPGNLFGAGFSCSTTSSTSVNTPVYAFTPHLAVPVLPASWSDLLILVITPP